MKVHPIASLVGSFVEVVTTAEVTITNETEEGRLEKSTPFTVSGFLIDIDENWLFLGDDQGNITDYVRIKRIIHVGKAKIVDEMEKLLDEESNGNEYYN